MVSLFLVGGLNLEIKIFGLPIHSNHHKREGHYRERVSARCREVAIMEKQEMSYDKY